jgi:sporulation protein YlmC with PRC-barrel domain
MKNKNTDIKRAVLVALLLAGGSAGLIAQETPTTPATPAPPVNPANPPDRTYGQSDKQERFDKKAGDTTAGIQSASQPMKINKASSLIGTTVKNQSGEDVGKIRDIVIDITGDRVAYCVLGVSPGVFNPEKLHAVPLRAFQPGADGTSLTLNIEKEKLARSEGFDKSNWPSMSNPAWGAEIQPLVPGGSSLTNALDPNRSLQQNRSTPDKARPPQ